MELVFHGKHFFVSFILPDLDISTGIANELEITERFCILNISAVSTYQYKFNIPQRSSFFKIGFLSMRG